MNLRFYRWRDGRGRVAIFGFFTALFFYSMFVMQHGWSAFAAYLGLTIFVISALLFRWFWLQRKEEIEIQSDRTVILHKSGFLGEVRTATFKLDHFGAIRSILVGSRNTTNLLELVSISGGESLRIAFRAPNERSSFFSIAPELSENSEISSLRTVMSEKWGLRDGGFQGRKWAGAAIKGSD